MCSALIEKKIEIHFCKNEITLLSYLVINILFCFFFCEVVFFQLISQRKQTTILVATFTYLNRKGNTIANLRTSHNFFSLLVSTLESCKQLNQIIEINKNIPPSLSQQLIYLHYNLQASCYCHWQNKATQSPYKIIVFVVFVIVQNHVYCQDYTYYTKQYGNKSMKYITISNPKIFFSGRLFQIMQNMFDISLDEASFNNVLGFIHNVTVYPFISEEREIQHLSFPVFVCKQNIYLS